MFHRALLYALSLYVAPHRDLCCLAAGAKQHILGLYVRMNDLHALTAEGFLVRNDSVGPLFWIPQNFHII